MINKSNNNLHPHLLCCYMNEIVWVYFGVKLEDKNMGPLALIYYSSVGEFSGSLQ